MTADGVRKPVGMCIENHGNVDFRFEFLEINILHSLYDYSQVRWHIDYPLGLVHEHIIPLVRGFLFLKVNIFPHLSNAILIWHSQS